MFQGSPFFKKLLFYLITEDCSYFSCSYSSEVISYCLLARLPSPLGNAIILHAKTSDLLFGFSNASSLCAIKCSRAYKNIRFG
nr:MAG TPA: hypothetical protein [Caudoviricetes sp.]